MFDWTGARLPPSELDDFPYSRAAGDPADPEANPYSPQRAGTVYANDSGVGVNGVGDLSEEAAMELAIRRYWSHRNPP